MHERFMDFDFAFKKIMFFTHMQVIHTKVTNASS